ncbi:conserved phage C-terminal domain-containing protein [Cohnella yongneupensis]|uniref:Conserved phage C-terminal domain-containing protein n=1 Tax=Cohnella yongneupensis TaxID=425006 RepID=A0ABW0QWF4_9BACL
MSRGPQKENGYTPIAHEILEVIGRYGLNGTQRGIIDQVWRYTYGFNRKAHPMALSFIADALGKKRNHVDKELDVLIERNIIQVVGTGKSRTRVLRFNKYFNTWDKPSSNEGRGDLDMTNVPHKEIIDYLNAKTSKRFSHKTKPTQALINGRFAEGRTFEDFKHVIDVKCAHWLGDPAMEQYLRPSTLFRPTNFENYLNQSVKDTGRRSASTFDQNKELLRRKMEEAQEHEGYGDAEDHRTDFDGLPEP